MFKAGDIIINKEVERRIVECLIDGTYLWEYPDLPEGEQNLFWSGNSNDPYLENQWRLKRPLLKNIPHIKNW